uniref:ANK-like n=1 Tax=Karlodinium veneficum TaxID=407301 RepID=A7YXX8_KARVE|nr:ANK-like [Karlodinium veneficum]
MVLLDISGGITRGVWRTLYLTLFAMSGTPLFDLRGLAFGREGGWPAMEAYIRKAIPGVKSKDLFNIKKSETRAKDDYGNTAFLIACEYGQTDLAMKLLADGSDVNAMDKNARGHGFSNTPLIFAAEKGHDIKLLKELIKKGAKINHVNHIGESPLSWAILRNDVEMVMELLAKGAKEEILDEFKAHTATREELKEKLVTIKHRAAEL